MTDKKQHELRCETCGHREVDANDDYYCTVIGDFIAGEIEMDTTAKVGCASHTSAGTVTRLLITDTRTGKQYTTDLQQLCIDAGLSDRLVYCDIERLLTDGETWYMLDECGNWAYLPAWYKVEGVR